MPQSLAQIVVHVVFSTRHREPTIDPAIRPALHAYLDGILQNLGCRPLETGGTADHVHSLIVLSRTRSIAEVIEEVKKSSSRWMKLHGRRSFGWQAGYGAFSVEASQADKLIQYIAGQEGHHRRLTFREEFQRLLDRDKIDYDERYLWD